MKNKRIVGILICALMLVTSMSVSAAIVTIEQNKINEHINDLQGDSSFILIGIVACSYEKIPWGFKPMYKPVCALIIGDPSGRHFVGPFSGRIDSAEYDMQPIIAGPLFLIGCVLPPGPATCGFLCAKFTPI